MRSPIERVSAAELILLPKNSNEEGATTWLRANDFDVPDFPGRSLTRQSEGRTYRRLRDPEIVSGVRSGKGDVGFLGSDKFEAWKPELSVDWVGEVPNCDFVLASRIGTTATVLAKLQRGERVSAITSNVSWLARLAVGNNWNVTAEYVSGSAEAFGDDADMIADLRVTGNSLRDNNLQEFLILDSVKLGLIYRS